ncbi:hypothetical protein PG991_011690 [Apiospora marii]|uniref:Uncharacterized protein n=1 Tax=Apiospora marii TaxID=335849 RepID=A0ABR1RFX6_9PEZI
MSTDDGPVYLGVWTNWSRGSAVLGATLTMTREYGNFLIALTALFVPFVASRFWRIFAIWFHQCYSSPEPRDALHHQRQVILRNSTSPESGLLSFIRLMWAWRRVARRPLRRVLPFAAFTFCSVALFGAAGIFTSEISTAGEVLVNGDRCQAGSNMLYDWVDAETASDAYVYWGTFQEKVASYARQCYSDENSGLLECSRLVTGSIPAAVRDENAPCPFDPDVCRRKDSNLRLDSGHLNTNDIFGLNSPPDETMTVRYVLQCAPLKTEGRSFNMTISGKNFTAYNYGPSLDSNAINADSGFNPVSKVISNYTYIVPDIAAQYPEAGIAYTNNNNFLLSSKPFYMGGGEVDGGSLFDPDPAIVRPDGDVTLIFLSGNGVNFAAPGEDDWYRATARLYNSTSDSEARREYRPDEAASPLGCVEQFQLCRDPARDQCGDLASGYDAVTSAAPWFNMTDAGFDFHDRPAARTKPAALLAWVFLMLFNNAISIPTIVDKLGPTSLASHDFVSQGYIDDIAGNQWQLDVTQWFNIMLAGFQTLFIDTAQGKTASSSDRIFFKPVTEFDWNLCRNQVELRFLFPFLTLLSKIRSAQYTSFSVLGLAITYALGTLIIVLSFVIEPILGCLQKRGRYDRYAYLEWEADAAIQLQRVAQDQLGYGRWSRCDKRIPVTRRGYAGGVRHLRPAASDVAGPRESRGGDFVGGA